jgi:hypothetical protein
MSKKQIKIERLTNEQEAKMPQYIQKWIKIGTDTSRFDLEEAIDIVHDVQQNILNQNKTPVLVFDDPIEAWVACCFAEKNHKANEIPKLVDKYFEGKKKIKLEPFTMPALAGSFDASTFAFYDFFRDELGISYEKNEEYEMWKRTTRLGLIYNIKDVSDHDMCIVSQKPIKVNLDENNVIHGDGKPAVEYAGRGKIKIYALHGTVVPEWLAMTRAQDIFMESYHEITNADVRTEFVRKVGVERMLDTGKKIDSYTNYKQKWWKNSQYELWDMANLFEGVEYAPHLKMLNPTTKVWHVEAVSPECRTLADAIKERFNGMDLEIVDMA